MYRIFVFILQSLFHLRRFRHLVLTYQPNNEVSQGKTEVSDKERNVTCL